MRQRLDNTDQYGSSFKSAYKMPPFVGVIADNYQLTVGHPALLVLDPGATSKDVLLPLATGFEVEGLVFDIYNNASVGGAMLVVKNSAETETVGNIAPGELMTFYNIGGDAFGWISGSDSLGGQGAAAVTATADGLTTGLIPIGAGVVAITSAAAANIVTLPLPSAGKEVVGHVAATGCEIRSLTGATINAVAFPNELALAANSWFRAIGLNGVEWVIKTCTKAGVVSATDVPDA